VGPQHCRGQSKAEVIRSESPTKKIRGEREREGKKITKFQSVIFYGVLVCERCGDPGAKHHAMLSGLLVAIATTRNGGMLLRLGHEGTFGFWDLFREFGRSFWGLCEVIDCAI
jgi:hypothetical protein